MSVFVSEPLLDRSESLFPNPTSDRSEAPRASELDPTRAKFLYVLDFGVFTFGNRLIFNKPNSECKTDLKFPEIMYHMYVFVIGIEIIKSTRASWDSWEGSAPICLDKRAWNLLVLVQLIILV